MIRKKFRFMIRFWRYIISGQHCTYRCAEVSDKTDVMQCDVIGKVITCDITLSLNVMNSVNIGWKQKSAKKVEFVVQIVGKKAWNCKKLLWFIVYWSFQAEFRVNGWTIHLNSTHISKVLYATLSSFKRQCFSGLKDTTVSKELSSSKTFFG